MIALKHRFNLLILLTLSSLFIGTVFADNSVDTMPELRNAGLLVLKHTAPPISKNENNHFTPASTTKLITAWLVLQNWGEDHHFTTDFFFDKTTHTLSIKGSGDPYLVSEELHLIAKNLKQLGLSRIDTIILDHSIFQNSLSVPGASQTSNPYDAIPSALAANFNTLNIVRNSTGIASAEKQTPITSTAHKIAQEYAVSNNAMRINTGFSVHDAERYFAELMIHFLRQQQIQVKQNILWATAPNTPPYYRHSNRKSLGEVVQIMLKYSNNFIANQLMLMVTTEFYHYPANFSDVQRYMHFYLQNYFGWQDFTLKEGAGLSRDNRLSPAQLVLLLNEFKQWKHLLPNIAKGIYAKSGTLRSVSTLAGYYIDNEQHWNAFSLMMKQSVHHPRRIQIIRQLVAK